METERLKDITNSCSWRFWEKWKKGKIILVVVVIPQIFIMICDREKNQKLKEETKEKSGKKFEVFSI